MVLTCEKDARGERSASSLLLRGKVIQYLREKPREEIIGGEGVEAVWIVGIFAEAIPFLSSSKVDHDIRDTRIVRKHDLHHVIAQNCKKPGH